jgi:hypothetical protein
MSFARQLQLFNATQQRQQRLAQNDNFTRLQDRLYEDHDDNQSQHLYQSKSEEIEEDTEEPDDDQDDTDEYTDDTQNPESSISSPSIWYPTRDLFIIFFLLGVALLVIFLSIYVIPKSITTTTTTSTSTSSNVSSSSSSSSTGTFIILPSGPVTSITDRSIVSPQVFYNTSTYLTYPSVFSINYNFSNQQFNDYSSNRISITQLSNNVSLCRDITRGGVLCNSSIQMTPSVSSLTSWTLSFWISSPPNNNHTNFTIISNLLNYPWNIGNLDITKFIPNVYINNWAFIVLSVTNGNLSIYWNGQYNGSISSSVVLPSLFSIYATNTQLDNITLLGQSVDTQYAQTVYNYSLGILKYQVLRLQYNNQSGLIEDHSGVNHLTSATNPNLNSPNTVTLSGSDHHISNWYTGSSTWSMNLVGCSEYTWTTWINLRGSIQSQVRLLLLYDNMNNPFPLAPFIYGCGLVLWGLSGVGIEQNKWTHVAITYQNDRNDFYMNGVHVFSWDAYTIPVPYPYLNGYYTLANSYIVSSQNISITDSTLYCTTLTLDQIQMDMTFLIDPEYQKPAYPPTLQDTTGVLLPNFSYPFMQDTEYIKQFFCVATTPADVAAVPTSIPNNYIHFYVDQLNGNDYNNGTTPSSAWSTPTNINMLGQFLLHYPILSSSTMFNTVVNTFTTTTNTTLSFSSGSILPTFASNVFGSCNAWYFNLQTYIPQLTIPLTTINTLGFTLSMWLNISYVNGIVSIGPTDQYSNRFQLQNYNTTHYAILASIGDEDGFRNPFGLALVHYIPYNHNVYVTFTTSIQDHLVVSNGIYTTSCHLFVNGDDSQTLVAYNLASTSPSITGPFFTIPYTITDSGNTITILSNVLPGGGAATTTFFGINAGSIIGYIGGLTIYDTSLITSASALALYNFVNSSNFSCNIVSNAIIIEICQGDRFYNMIPFSIHQGNTNQPVVIRSRDCGRQPIYPLLSALSILPQTTQIGWQQVDYTSLTGIVWNNVLMYNLSLLYQLNPLYLGNVNPINNIYTPIVQGLFYMQPRAPNLNNPLYPWGYLHNHSMWIWNYTDIFNGGDPGNVNSESTYVMPGSWCYTIYYQMFQLNSTAYDLYFLNTTKASTFMNDAIPQSMEFDYAVPEHGGFPYGLNWHQATSWVNYLNCSLWYETEVNIPNDPYTLGYEWEDLNLLTLGIWDIHLNTYGYGIPASIPGVTPIYNSLSGGFLQQHGAPLWTTNPIAIFPGTTACLTKAWYMMQSNILFDAPGEYIYDQTNAIIYLIPWNDHHRSLLLTINTTMDIVNNNYASIVQNTNVTLGWASIYNSAITTNGIQMTMTNLKDFESNIIIQELELSGWNGWAINIKNYNRIRILNVSVHHIQNGIFIFANEGHSFIINTLVANITFTIPNKQILPTNGGPCWACQSASTTTCNIINSTCFFTNGENGFNFVRNTNYYAMYSDFGYNDMSQGNPFMMEHSVLNQSGTDCGDCGIFVNGGIFYFRYTTWDDVASEWSTGIDSVDITDANDICYNPNPYKPTARLIYWNEITLIIHGMKFPHAGVDFTGLPSHNGYMNNLVDCGGNIGSGPCDTEILYQFTSNLFGNYMSELIGSANEGSIHPQTPQAAIGRPYTWMNNLAYHDQALLNPATQPWEFPLFYPGYQSQHSFWQWETDAAYIIDFYMCHGIVNVTNTTLNLDQVNSITQNDLYYNTNLLDSILPTYYPQAVGNGVSDFNIAKITNNPTVQFGYDNCQSVINHFEQALDNERNIHFKATEAAIQALIKTQIPLWLEPIGTGAGLDGQMWQGNVDDYNPTTPNKWPGYNDGHLNCTNTTSCSMYLMMSFKPNPLSGQWTDSVFNQSQITSIVSPSDGSTLQVGSSWDSVFGGVFDSSISQKYSLTMSYPYVLHTYTYMFWVYYPVYPYVIDSYPTYTQPTGSSNGIPFSSIPISFSRGGTPFYGYYSICNYVSITPVINCIYFTENQQQQPGNQIAGYWNHYTLTSNMVENSLKFYLNGVYQLTWYQTQTTYFGGTTNPFTFMGGNVKLADIRIYGGECSPTAIYNIYNTSTTSFNGPTTYPFIQGQMVFQLTYNSTSGMFWNGNTQAPAAVLTLGAFSGTNNNYVNISTIDPLGSTMVIQSGSSFSITTPNVNKWSFSIQLLLPSNNPNSLNGVLWFMQSSSITVNQSYPLAMLFTRTSTSSNVYTPCLLLDVQQPYPVNGVIGGYFAGAYPVTYNQSHCWSGGGFTWTLGAWMTFTWNFDNLIGTVSLFINGSPIGTTLSGLVGLLASTRVFMFFPPEFMVTGVLCPWGVNTGIGFTVGNCYQFSTNNNNPNSNVMLQPYIKNIQFNNTS